MQDSLQAQSRTSSVYLAADKLGLGVLLYAYATLLGAIYIFGYWRAIGFDVFPYASSIDYISAPLNRLLVLVSVPILFSFVLFSQSDRKDGNFIVKLSGYLILLYSVSFGFDYYRAVMAFFGNKFHYENEKSVLVLALVLFAASVGISYRIYKHDKSIFTCVAALVLMQLAGTVSAGYRDGKAVFNGAANVFFLDNKDICEPNGIIDWVYLGKFSTKSFFLNTIDKRLCITEAGSYKLSPQKFAEGL
ncbi:hypothetical protein [Alicycliphilus denitrificans]|uniref:hypothetical protein n=1 Tax=Alicycliphilus denitrificans TaxID=179636 RepID=UPI00384F03FE